MVAAQAAPALASTTVSNASVRVTGPYRLSTSTLQPSPVPVGRNSSCSVSRGGGFPGGFISLDFTAVGLNVVMPYAKFHDGTVKLLGARKGNVLLAKWQPRHTWEIAPHHQSASLTLSNNEMSGQLTATLYPDTPTHSTNTQEPSTKVNPNKKPVHVVAHWNCAGDWHIPFPPQP